MKITLNEVIQTFKLYNQQHKIEYGVPSRVPKMSAVVVYKQSNFLQEYSEKARSYRIRYTNGKAFFTVPSGSRSMWGSSLDGSDPNVRLDAMGWKVDYCYFE